jgi:hypothetical protein
LDKHSKEELSDKQKLNFDRNSATIEEIKKLASQNKLNQLSSSKSRKNLH